MVRPKVYEAMGDAGLRGGYQQLLTPPAVGLSSTDLPYRLEKSKRRGVPCFPSQSRLQLETSGALQGVDGATYILMIEDYHDDAIVKKGDRQQE